MICIFDCPPIEFFYNISIFTYNKIKRTVLSVCPSDSTYVFLAFKLFFRNEKKNAHFPICPFEFWKLLQIPSARNSTKSSTDKKSIKNSLYDYSFRVLREQITIWPE